MIAAFSVPAHEATGAGSARSIRPSATRMPNAGVDHRLGDRPRDEWRLGRHLDVVGLEQVPRLHAVALGDELAALQQHEGQRDAFIGRATEQLVELLIQRGDRHENTLARVVGQVADRVVQGADRFGTAALQRLAGRIRSVEFVAAARKAHGDTVEFDIAGHQVGISSPNKVMFPERGETKLDLANYYVAIGDALMRTVRDRPTLLQRFPNGVGGQSFFQKRIPDSAPDWLQTTTVATVNGTESRAIVMADVAHVLWAANQGVLGFHPWPYHASRPADIDELRLDLDPSPGTTFEMVREAAGEVRDFLDELGITAFPKTTGNRGLHLYVRVEPGWDSFGTRQAAISVARAMEARRPELITAAWWKEERGARIFIDFNQNAPHKTVFGAWCVRARPGAAGVDAVQLGRTADGPPRSPHAGHRARARRHAG